MKKFLILLTLTMSSLSVFGQIYEIPKRTMVHPTMNLYCYGRYKIGPDGYYQLESYDKARSMSASNYFSTSKGNERYFCYSKEDKMYFFYTDNIIGFYNPSNDFWEKNLRKALKDSKVRKINIDELPNLLSNVINEMNIIYEKKNDSIAEVKRLERNKFIQDSIANEKKRQVEQGEYRKTHDWRDLTMSRTYGLKCEFCDEYHYLKNYRVMLLNADTLYYFLEKPDITYLGINHVDIHYSTLTWDFKNDSKFKEYVNIWHDSIDNNNNFSKQDAALFNLIQYNEFRDKVSSTAPSGFLQRWGWKLNSAQGIEPFFTFFNSSKKTIKYVDFYFSMFNAVGDRCYLKYERSYIGNVRGVGPVEPFEPGSWNWDRATHYTSGDAYEMRIVKLVITYMDRTTKTIPNSSIIYDNNK